MNRCCIFSSISVNILLPLFLYFCELLLCLICCLCQFLSASLSLSLSLSLINPFPNVLNHTVIPHSGEQWMHKLKFHLVRTQNLNIPPFKPGVGQYIAIHATLTARDFFPAYFYPSGPFTCIFSKTSPDFSCVGCS